MISSSSMALGPWNYNHRNWGSHGSEVRTRVRTRATLVVKGLVVAGTPSHPMAVMTPAQATVTVRVVQITGRASNALAIRITTSHRRWQQEWPTDDCTRFAWCRMNKICAKFNFANSLGTVPCASYLNFLPWKQGKGKKLRWKWLMDCLYKNEYRIFKPVEVTRRSGLRKKEEK
jgi:hypothetical protein